LLYVEKFGAVGSVSDDVEGQGFVEQYVYKLTTSAGAKYEKIQSCADLVL